ncbi:MAG: sel1 repeat family protein [Gammaproteobacteria bacterium]|nr:sel1 repeat family protein [Gammaproteobacteria bacterium]
MLILTLDNASNKRVMRFSIGSITLDRLNRLECASAFSPSIVACWVKSSPVRADARVASISILFKVRSDAMCVQMSNYRMLFSRLRFLLSRSSGLSGCVCLWLTVLAVPVHAESLEKAIEAYDFKEYQEAAQWLRPWAEKGEVEAQYRFGTLYENGQGVAKNLEEAKRWYRNAAAQGHVRARRRLEALEGRPARSGSETVAIKWYQDLAEQGDADAQYNLAFMYETGFSVPKDNGKAAHWYDAAAEKKHVLAQRV